MTNKMNPLIKNPKAFSVRFMKRIEMNNEDCVDIRSLTRCDTFDEQRLSPYLKTLKYIHLTATRQVAIRGESPDKKASVAAIGIAIDKIVPSFF